MRNMHWRAWAGAAVVLAALVHQLPAQEPAPKPEPRIRVEPRIAPDIRFDARELEDRARAMAERFEYRFDFDLPRPDAHFDFQFDMPRPDVDFDLEFGHLADLRYELAFPQGALADIREFADEARWRVEASLPDFIERPFIGEFAPEPALTYALEDARVHAERAMDEVHARLPDMEYRVAESLARVSERFESRAAGPRPAWAPNDPADSLYRLAREMLNRGNYRRAADLFHEISEKHPASDYAAEALYWQAFALYRIGGTGELERARAVLETQRARHAAAYAKSDGAALASRIAGELARRGNPAALRDVSRTAGQRPTCDKEEMAVRVEALNALSEMDFAAARPSLERVLARQDDCAKLLRKRAVFLIGKHGGESAAELLGRVARSDADNDVRADAVLWLSRVPGEQTVSMLEGLMTNGESSEQVQRAALRALAAHGAPRARQVVRSVAERNDASEKLREYAISALDGKDATAEDAAFLRGLYPRLTSERLKRSTIRAVASIEGRENEQWLMSIAQNNDEAMEFRAEALGRIARSSAITIPELGRMYDAMGTRALREQLISAFARRKEPEATDKLIEIARSGTDPHLRRHAIAALTRKNDPRTTKLLLEIIEP